MQQNSESIINIQAKQQQENVIKETMAQLLNESLSLIHSNQYMITNNVFTDVMSRFRELIVQDKFGEDKELGKLNKFIHDFQINLKKKLYEEKLSSNYLIESKINSFFKELQRNTDAFMEKHEEIYKQRNKVFKSVLKSVHFRKDGTADVELVAKKFSQYLSKTNDENLRYIAYSRNIRDDLTNYLEENGGLYREDVNSSEFKLKPKSETYKEEIRTQLQDALKEKIRVDKDRLTTKIHRLQRKQIRKIALFQDKMDYKLDMFTENFLATCKNKNISDRSTVVSQLVRQLESKNLFNYYDIEKVASVALEKLSRDGFFNGVGSADKDAFVKELKRRAVSNNLIDLDRYGVLKKDSRTIKSLFYRPRLKRSEFFHTFDALEKRLIERTENQELTDKAAMSPYISELLELLISRDQIELPHFENDADKKAFIAEKHHHLVETVNAKIDSFRKQVVDDAINRISGRKKFTSPAEKLALLLAELKDQKILKGKLHYPAISEIIIDKLWAQTPELTPKEFKNTKKFYKQTLIDIYSEDVALAQKKIAKYNKAGLLASTGSLGLGIWAIAVISGAATAPVLGPVSAIAPGAIVTSLTGLINSSYATGFTTKKEFAQDMVNEILNEGEKGDYRELFDNIPTVGKITTRLSLNPQMKKNGDSEYSLFAEFMEQLDNLRFYQAQDLIKELNISNLDLSTPEGGKKFLIKFLHKAQSTIEARINISEANSVKYAKNSYIASLGTFSAGTLVTVASTAEAVVPGLGLALGAISAAITGTGMVSITNAALLDQTKRSSTRPLNKLYTNLSMIINHIHSDKAHIELPSGIISAYEKVVEANGQNQQTKVEPALVSEIVPAEPQILVADSEKALEEGNEASLETKKPAFIADILATGDQAEQANKASAPAKAARPETFVEKVRPEVTSKPLSFAEKIDAPSAGDEGIAVS